jgi:hypothetical protein
MQAERGDLRAAILVAYIQGVQHDLVYCSGFFEPLEVQAVRTLVAVLNGCEVADVAAHSSLLASCDRKHKRAMFSRTRYGVTMSYFALYVRLVTKQKDITSLQ